MILEFIVFLSLTLFVVFCFGLYMSSDREYYINERGVWYYCESGSDYMMCDTL